MAQVFRGGLPYGPDIKRLDESFPVPELTEGRIIEHVKLQEILGYAKGSQRYYGVVNSWIKHQRNDNSIIIAWEPASGLRILKPHEVLGLGEKRIKQKINQTGRAFRMLDWVDAARLDTMGQKRLDHDNRVRLAVKTSLESAKKELAIDLAPVQSLPKPKRT